MDVMLLRYIYKALRRVRDALFFGPLIKIKNEHLNAEMAEMKRIGDGCYAHLRPSASDSARLQEFYGNIYFVQNYLSLRVLDKSPKVLFDVGANIGLSSLSLSKVIGSIRDVVGVEAEYENFSVLSKNYSLWSKKGLISFLPIYAIAADDSVSRSVSVSRLSGGTSASGTFSFSLASDDVPDFTADSPEIKCSSDIVSLGELFQKHLGAGECAVIKVDIEGGEDALFRMDCSWLAKTAYLTIELHDGFGLPTSSRNVLKALVEYDFAVIPRDDVLHCYNRPLLGL